MKNATLKTLLGSSLIASLVIAPVAALAKNADLNAEANAHVSMTNGCVKAFGHLIAPGWIKASGTTTVDSACKLPFGISLKLGLTQHPPKPGTTTPDTKAPSIFVVHSSTGTSTAKVTWFTNERADTQLAYGTTTTYGSLSALDSGLTFFHRITVTGLDASTTYHFKVMSRDASGNLGVSADGTFTTDPLPDTTAPAISVVSVSGISSTTATVAWTTDEPANSKVYFASGTSLDLSTATAVANTALVVGHAITLDDLTASTTYSFAVRSEDAVGNTSTSATSSFVTGL